VSGFSRTSISSSHVPLPPRVAWHTTCRTIRLEYSGLREDPVTDNSRATAAAVVGAIIGGIAGYLFFTERGRSLRRSIEPALEDIARELSSFRGTVQKAAGVASEGWKLLNDAMGETTGPRRFPTPHQTSPF
jgi:hypothetical protein